MTPDFLSLAAFRYSIRRFLKTGETALAEANVEPQQYQVLLAIKAHQLQNEEAAICDLADDMLLTHQSAVGLIDRLEKRGLVERTRHSGDPRRVQVILTKDGDSTLTYFAGVFQAQLQLLGPELIASLTSILETVQAEGVTGAAH
jgi:DNA-binding MarR family transcriptional regulator